MANIIEIVIRAKDQMSAGLKKAEGNVNNFSASLKQMAMASAGVAALGLSMKKILDLAGKQEQAEKLLAAAMKQAGTYTDRAFEHNLDYAASLQKITTYGDEAIMVVQKMLTNFGVEGPMLDRLTKATLDLAAAKGFDLKSAADLVAKSVGSSTNALTRYGITIEGAVGSTERMEMAVENITKLFGGSAAAAADTYIGRMEQLDNIMLDVGEKFGDLMLPTVTKDMEALATAVGAVSDTMVLLDDKTGKGWLNDATQALMGIYNPLAQIRAVLDLVKSLRGSGGKSGYDFGDGMQFGPAGKFFAGWPMPSGPAAPPGPSEEMLSLADAIEKVKAGWASQGMQNLAEWMAHGSEIAGPRDLDMSSLDDMEVRIGVNLPEALAEAANGADLFREELLEMGLTGEQVADGISNAFGYAVGRMIMEGENMGQILKNAFKSWAASAIADIMRVIAKLIMLKMAKIAAMGPLGFLFEEGGVVPAYPLGGMVPAKPTLPFGHVLAAVKPGEMILNQHQQARLFRALDRGYVGGGAGAGAGTTINHYNIPAMDAKSFRHELRHGTLGRELARAGY